MDYLSKRINDYDVLALITKLNGRHSLEKQARRLSKEIRQVFMAKSRGFLSVFRAMVECDMEVSMIVID